jgi:hypothetical protein
MGLISKVPYLEQTLYFHVKQGTIWEDRNNKEKAGTKVLTVEEQRLFPCCNSDFPLR